jgi:hypothetical protein
LDGFRWQIGGDVRHPFQEFSMLNNIGPGGLLFLVLLVLGIWLLIRDVAGAGRRKAAEQKRIADALEEIAKSKKDDEKS